MIVTHKCKGSGWLVPWLTARYKLEGRHNLKCVLVLDLLVRLHKQSSNLTQCILMKLHSM